MDSILEKIIGDFQERPLPSLTQREVSLPYLPGKIDTLIGMRRTGKSCRVYQAMTDLLAAGTPKESLLYLNLDDERLYPLAEADLHRIPETFFRLTPENKHRRCHFFFDEIQNVSGWEHFIRRLLDTENAQITLTGSSAKLLGREIATTLRGRSLATEIFPFSFRETLRHLKELENVDSLIGSARRALLINRLRSYLDCGGFPEVQGVNASLRARILQEYVDVVILRDVVERHGISNLAPLRYLIRHLLSSPATAFSVNRFHNDLKSQGIACSKNSLHDYLAHLEDAYLVQSIHLDSRSVRQQQVNLRKIYPIDTGLVRAFHYDTGVDRGRLLETLVFLDLRRRGLQITYFRSEQGFEVDFFARSLEAEPQAIQVAETIADPQTRQRELRALECAMAERHLTRGTLITLDEEERIATAHGPIEVIPAWRWLLRKE